jgi:hypothetical protein
MAVLSPIFRIVDEEIRKSFKKIEKKDVIEKNTRDLVKLLMVCSVAERRLHCIYSDRGHIEL